MSYCEPKPLLLAHYCLICNINVYITSLTLNHASSNYIRKPVNNCSYYQALVREANYCKCGYLWAKGIKFRTSTNNFVCYRFDTYTSSSFCKIKNWNVNSKGAAELNFEWPRNVLEKSFNPEKVSLQAGLESTTSRSMLDTHFSFWILLLRVVEKCLCLYWYFIL